MINASSSRMVFRLAKLVFLKISLLGYFRALGPLYAALLLNEPEGRANGQTDPLLKMVVMMIVVLMSDDNSGSWD